jgi:hypothetical protein
MVSSETSLLAIESAFLEGTNPRACEGKAVILDLQVSM